MTSDLIRGCEPVCRRKRTTSTTTKYRVRKTARPRHTRRHLALALKPVPARLDRSDRLCRCRALRPQFFQIVELAHLGSEYMDDHVAGIDQHPIAIGQALDVDAFDPGFLQPLGDVFRNRTDVPVDPARG